ncbi:tyrosine-type recombinase/integrase [Mycobacterium sp. C3-094]
MTQRRGPKARATATSTWAPLIDAYLMTLAAAGRSVHTIALRQQQLSALSRELGCAPRDVTGVHFIRWLSRHADWSVEHRRSNRNAARLFFLWAYKAGHIPVHIADDLPQIKTAVAVPRPAPEVVWRQALQVADLRTTLILRLAGEAGLRRAEIAQVHTRDLIEAAGGAQLLVHGKGGKRRIVPLNESLAELIRRGPSHHTPGAPAGGWLFPNMLGGHLTPKYVAQLAQRMLPAPWTLHTLRHRFSSRAYRGTRNLRAVQQLLGHASIATTERYLAVDDDEIRAAAMAAAL